MQIEQVNERVNLSIQGRGVSPQRVAVPSAPKRSDQIDLRLPQSVIDAQPDVRENRIEAVRARVMDGFYDRPEVQKEIAGVFLNAQLA